MPVAPHRDSRRLRVVSTPSLVMDESILQNVLEQHSYLDFTPYVSVHDRTGLSSGGYSDVFCSHLRLGRGWQSTARALANRNVIQLLDEVRYASMGDSPTPIKVAVKVLRSIGRTDSKIEKVRRSSSTQYRCPETTRTVGCLDRA